MEWNALNQPRNDQQQKQEPANIERDIQIPRNADGSLDGGVAVPPESNKSAATECDLMLFLECTEPVEGYEDHPILSPGVIVCIGLEKASKLGAVFERYVEFANEHSDGKHERWLRLQDLEFVHCTILRSSDTPEASALMKNDRIRVQKSRREEKALEAEAMILQCEADRNYFENLRGLMTDIMGSCDIVLDCQGKLVDENGLNQEVLRTTLRGHSAILSKRCKWLERLIQRARLDLGRRSIVSIPDADQLKDQHMRTESDDGDDGIAALPYPAEPRDDNRTEGATEIENDDDEDANSLSAISRSGSPVLSSSYASDLVWVTIPNHPPEAVKLLLEYCYTNSVIPLGQEAFEVAWSSSHEEGSSQARPHSRQWPDKRKHPRVSFATALAGISLAEEASLPRLSLMCEVAACSLLESSNIVEALSMCTRQDQLTGNPLKRLRTAAMTIVLRKRDLDHLTRTHSFKRALLEPERCAVLVPSLLIGTMEAIIAREKQPETAAQGELINRITQDRMEELDREDIFHREMERRKHRAGSERRFNPPFMQEDDRELHRNAFVKWDAVAQVGKHTLKRSSYSSWGKQSRHSRKHKKGPRAEKFTVKKW